MSPRLLIEVTSAYRPWSLREPLTARVYASVDVPEGLSAELKGSTPHTQLTAYNTPHPYRPTHSTQHHQAHCMAEDKTTPQNLPTEGNMRQIQIPLRPARSIARGVEETFEWRMEHSSPRQRFFRARRRVISRPRHRARVPQGLRACALTETVTRTQIAICGLLPEKNRKH